MRAEKTRKLLRTILFGLPMFGDEVKDAENELEELELKACRLEPIKAIKTETSSQACSNCKHDVNWKYCSNCGQAIKY